MSLVAAEPVARSYRFSRCPVVREILGSIEYLEPFALEHVPGRYDVDQHSLDPFPGTKVSSRAWGKVIHHQDGQVVLDPIPWQQ
jgi:hypothetical protein